MGPGAGLARGYLVTVRVDARRGVGEARVHGTAAAAAGADARAQRREHARGARRDRVSHQRRTGTDRPVRRLPGRRCAGDLRRDRAVQKLSRGCGRAMTRKRWLQAAGIVVIFAVAVWGASQLLERMVSPVQQQQSAPAPPAPAATVPHIIATLYYGTQDGQALAGLKREVPLGEGPRAQGRQILQSELEPAPPPYVSVIPPGTTLRAFYITDRGDAFVDLSPEVSTMHPGGSTNELLTVYAIVNTVTANLSSVERVQILIDGKQADTLAGHVDLRRPFEHDTSLINESKGTE